MPELFPIKSPAEAGQEEMVTPSKGRDLRNGKAPKTTKPGTGH